MGILYDFWAHIHVQCITSFVDIFNRIFLSLLLSTCTCKHGTLETEIETLTLCLSSTYTYTRSIKKSERDCHLHGQGFTAPVAPPLPSPTQNFNSCTLLPFPKNTMRYMNPHNIIQVFWQFY